MLSPLRDEFPFNRIPTSVKTCPSIVTVALTQSFSPLSRKVAMTASYSSGSTSMDTSCTVALSNRPTNVADTSAASTAPAVVTASTLVEQAVVPTSSVRSMVAEAMRRTVRLRKDVMARTSAVRSVASL